MSRKWVRDINYAIHRSGKHWIEEEHPANPDVRLIHPLYRVCLNDNLLMNLFRNASNPDDTLTFDAYYGSRVSVVLDTFRMRFETLPRDDFDVKELRAFRRFKVQAGEAILANAVARASEQDAADLLMKDLYLDAYYEHPGKDALDSIVLILQQFQRTMEWVCIPFLKFSTEEPDSNYPRPSEDDLMLHLNGGTYDKKPLMGFGAFDYHDMLFHEHQSQDEADMHHNARMFAFEKHFFDRENVVARVLRDYQAELENDSTIAVEKWDKEITGGGNGYRCEMVPSIPGDPNSPLVRKCVVGTPVDYCVNNNSQYCPTT